MLSSLAGYGFSRYGFRGSRSVFGLILSTLLIPITSIALPLYLVYAKVGLIDSIWGMVLPSMVAPVGVYLMRTYDRRIRPARADGRRPHRRRE